MYVRTANSQAGTAAGKETAKLKEVMSRFLADHGAEATVMAATASTTQELSPVSSGFRQVRAARAPCCTGVCGGGGWGLEIWTPPGM